jgi:hypothetical protein
MTDLEQLHRKCSDPNQLRITLKTSVVLELLARMPKPQTQMGLAENIYREFVEYGDELDQYQMKDRIAAILAKHSEARMPKWVSVTEKLPEPRHEVWVAVQEYGNDPFRDKFTAIARRNNDGEWFADSDEGTFNYAEYEWRVSHWMEMNRPAPPEVEGEEK